jgi:hypothetical protein
MSNLKIDERTVGILLIALVGGVIGGSLTEYLAGSEFLTQAAFRTELLSKDTQIAALNTQIATLNNKISTLENEYTQLSTSLETLETLSEAGFNAPDYDSDWLAIDQGDSVEVNHSLGTTNLLVYLIGEFDDNYTHQYAYGGNEERYIEYEIVPGEYYYDAVEKYGTLGAWWRTDGEDRILVFRPDHDDQWNEFRVLIWRLPDFSG